MTPFPTLHTPRLMLRELTAADAPELFAIHTQNKFMPWYGWTPMPDLRAAEQAIEAAAQWRREPATGVRWALQWRDDPQMVGTCALYDWQPGWRCCTLDFELSHGLRGKGLMREALQAVLAWGFGQMALNRVESQVHHLNLPAMRLLRALSFEQEGCRREAGFWDAAYHDLLLFGLLRREFGVEAVAGVTAL
jgi:ribosomal-protein-alanine N-acetyltransferase